LNIGVCSNFESRSSKIKQLERFDSPGKDDYTAKSYRDKATETYTSVIDLDDIEDSTIAATAGSIR